MPPTAYKPGKVTSSTTFYARDNLPSPIKRQPIDTNQVRKDLQTGNVRVIGGGGSAAPIASTYVPAPTQEEKEAQASLVRPKQQEAPQQTRTIEIRGAQGSRELKQPSNVGESIISNTILSGALGIQPAKTNYEQYKSGEITKAEYEQRQREKVTAGLVFEGAGAIRGARQVGESVIERVAPQVSKAVAKVSPKVKSGVIYGTSGALYVGGAAITQVEKENQASIIARDTGISKDKAIKLIEQANRETISRGLAGRVNAEGEEVVAPEIGGNDLVGAGQRLALSGVPGLTGFFTATQTNREIAVQALESQGAPVTEKNIKTVEEAVKRTGAASTIGTVASEVASELAVGRYTRKGSPGLSKAVNRETQTTALRSVIVPPTIVAGALEGGTQTYNIQSLTTSKPKAEEVAVGGAIGGVSAGAFSYFITAPASVRGKAATKGALGLGYALDFPGEPAGDIIAGLVPGNRGLRIRTLSVSDTAPSVLESGNNKSIYTPSKKGTKGGAKTFIPGIGNVPTDRYGLPLPSLIRTPSNANTNTPSDTDTPSNTDTDTLGDTFTNIFNNSRTSIYSDSQTETQTNVTTNTNINVPSETNVPSITPSQFPFFPPGRLGGGSGTGKGKTRLGYYDELAAALTGINPRTGTPLRTMAASRAPQNKRLQRDIKQRKELLNLEKQIRQNRMGRPAKRQILRSDVFESNLTGSFFGFFGKRKRR